jgi:hypothetical protein
MRKNAGAGSSPWWPTEAANGGGGLGWSIVLESMVATTCWAVQGQAPLAGMTVSAAPAAHMLRLQRKIAGHPCDDLRATPAHGPSSNLHSFRKLPDQTQAEKQPTRSACQARDIVGSQDLCEFRGAFIDPSREHHCRGGQTPGNRLVQELSIDVHRYALPSVRLCVEHKVGSRILGRQQGEGRRKLEKRCSSGAQRRGFR